MDVTITINRADVFKEVAQTASYTGAKMVDDADAYDRIRTVDEDQSQLNRFWEEACNAVTEQVKEFATSVNTAKSTTQNYDVELAMPSNFDENVTGSLTKSIFSFIVLAILGKWYKITNKPEADATLADAASMLENAVLLFHSRKRPKRPTDGCYCN